VQCNLFFHKNYIAEFTNFNKNFFEKAPKPKTGLKDFLSLFEQKSDPSKQEEHEDEDVIIISDYFKHEKNDVIKIEGYYVNKIA
jgi:hypothetical protein